MVVPAIKGSNVEITSPYGWREHPIHGGRRFHAGVDFAGMDKAATVQGGTVIMAQNWDGYGGTIMVKTPDGRVEQFSHLRKFNVKRGQRIAPGVVVGSVGGGVGDPMSGDSTGRHLHFQVWVNDRSFVEPQKDTINPETYLRSTRLTTYIPRGLGLPPRQGNPGRMGTQPMGGFKNPHSWSIKADSVPNSAYPTPNLYATSSKAQYGRNNPTANYGYSALAKDPQFAKKVASVANRLNIPAQWLVDLMAFETGGTFDPAKKNDFGAVGLIQFYPDQDYGVTKTHNGERWNLNTLAGMTRTEQMEYVYKFLSPYKHRLNKLEDLIEVVFGTGVDQYGTSNATYFKALGSHVGRKYVSGKTNRRDVAARRIHTTYRPGCPSCARSLSLYGKVIPHEGVY